jgi:tetratricopeptide (TPR) repeat protein
LLDIFRAQLAMQYGLVRTAQKLLPKRETARIFQGIRENSFVYKNTNLFELNLLSILKFTTAQCDYRNKNYERALRTLSPHNLMEVEINSPKYLNFISHLALNNIGLINFRLEKYTLALYFISKSLENVNKTSSTVADEREQLIVQHFNAKQEYLLINQALVLLKLNKPKEAYEHFCRITKPSKNYKFWYRFGQAALEHYHELLI